MIRVAILDLDGPILEGRYRHFQCYSDIVNDLGCCPLPIDRYWEMKRNRVSRLIQLELINASHLYDEFLKQWLQRIELKKYLAIDQVQPGAHSTLEFLREQRIRTALITMRNQSDNLIWQLNRLGISDYFDDIIAVSSDHGVEAKKKAAEAAMGAALPCESLWIGDTEVDVLSAKGLNIPVCAVHNGLRTEEFLSSLSPDYLISSISEVNAIVLGSA